MSASHPSHIYINHQFPLWNHTTLSTSGSHLYRPTYSHTACTVMSIKKAAHSNLITARVTILNPVGLTAVVPQTCKQARTWLYTACTGHTKYIPTCGSEQFIMHEGILSQSAQTTSFSQHSLQIVPATRMFCNGIFSRQDDMLTAWVLVTSV
jgi:hypothetical protein